jgi:hypothetical protein
MDPDKIDTVWLQLTQSLGSWKMPKNCLKRAIMLSLLAGPVHG